MTSGKPEYCPTCGTGLSERDIEGRKRRYCETCNEPVYRNAKPCAGVLVIDGDAALLVKRSEPPDAGSWSVPAGYCEVDEPPLVAAQRELEEETGLVVTGTDPKLFETKLVEHPNGTYVLVLVYIVGREATTGAPRAGDDAQAARFWTAEDIAEQPAELETGYAILV